MKKVCINAVAHYLPPSIVSSSAIETKIKRKSPNIQFLPGIIKNTTGVETRRFADRGICNSDLAIKAVDKLLTKFSLEKKYIDLLIFAAAGQNFVEPATANVIQEALGLQCSVFDLKNACNSFVDAITVATALIRAGTYKHVLIANGEVSSTSIKYHVKNNDEFQKTFSGYTLGDGAAAMILSESMDDRGIEFSDHISYGKYWSLCTFMGGGTRYPRDPEKAYILSDSKGLYKAFVKEKIWERLLGFMAACHLSWDEIDLIVPHQVSTNSVEKFAKYTQAPLHKLKIILPEYGNLAAASIPTTLSLAEEEGRLKKGDRIMLVGLGAGISFSIHILKW